MKPSPEYNVISFTVDIDWAPDFMIDEMATLFTRFGVKCTWFVTHLSPAIERLRLNPLFELGIHPNFLPGSSHGCSEDEVLNFCMDMVPNARVVRTHALFQHTYLLRKMKSQYGLVVDCSLFMPYMSQLVPQAFYVGRGEHPLVRIPFFWEDDVECLNTNQNWKLNAQILEGKGIRMFNFHPFYVGINETDFKRYIQVKTELCKKKKLYELSREELEPYMSLDKGVGTFFRDLLREIYTHGLQTYWPTEIATEFLRETGLGT